MRRVLLTIVIALLCVNLYAQQRNITGTVLDSENNPVAGVSVKIQGTAVGALTDVDGKYVIRMPENAKDIEFSGISYRSKTEPIANRSLINVILENDIIGLEEVVSIGYGVQKKENLTGAVTSVSVKDVEGRALTNADQILQGKVSGVSIVQNSGRPGDDNSEIRIRGISSIDNNNDPLVIINGVQGSINDVSPNDIASVSVLKDAASAAIYGSRASAGVIIIETKQGTGKGLTVDYVGTGTVSNTTRLPKPADSYNFALLFNEARVNMDLAPTYTEARLEAIKNQSDPNQANTDWYDVYFQQGKMQNHYINLKGGDKNYRFSNSLTYKDQQGVLIGTKSNRISYNSNLSGNFLKNKIKVNLGLVGYTDKSDELVSPTNQIMAEIAAAIPTAFVQSIDTLTGNRNLYSYPGRFLGAKNLGGGINNNLNSLNTRASIEITPIKNLTAKILIGNNRLKTDYVGYSPEFFTSSDFEENAINLRESFLEKRFSQSDLNTFSTTLEYLLKKNKHEFKVLAAHEKLETIYSRDLGSVKNLSSNAPIFNFGDPTSPFLSSNAYEIATSSYFGRINYSYNNKYLLEFNLRRDGSSRFSGENQWGNFPSLSAAWRISEEKFLKNINFPYTKLRASWGRLGNQNIYTQYAFADQMGGSEYYAFGNSVVPGRGTTILANRGTKWETTEQFDIGLDMVLWNRLDVTIDYFKKNTFDILSRVTIPPSLGVSALPYQNIGNMTNKGLEISLGYNSKPSKDKLNYSVNVNASYITNKLTSLGGLDFVDHSLTNRSVVGQPFSSYYGYNVEGIYQVSDFTWQNNSDESIPHDNRNYVLNGALPNANQIMANLAPGDIRIKDINNDNIIDDNDKELIGSPIPKLQYSFSTNLSYKNFGLGIIGQGVGRVDAYMNGYLIAPFFNTTGPILNQDVQQRWTFDNPSDRYHRVYVDKGRDALITSYNIYNAAYFRLKSIQLSYNLPQRHIEKLGISRCRFFINAENVFLLTNFIDGFDPERNYQHVTAAFHPQIATYSLGVNLNF